MHNGFSDSYGAWPTAFFIFERQSAAKHAEGGGGDEGGDCDYSQVSSFSPSSLRARDWCLTYRSRATHEAHIDVMEVLEWLWSRDLSTV